MNLKKTVAGLLIVATLAAPVSAMNNISDWAISDLAEANNNLGIIPDCLSDADVKMNVTRGEMCEIAALAYAQVYSNGSGKKLIPAMTNYFSDVPTAEEASSEAELTRTNAISGAYEVGLVNGYPDGTFQPDKLLTRQEYFKIVSNFLDVVGIPFKSTKDFLGNFSDRDDLDSWAEDCTQKVVGCGVVQGTPMNGTSYLNPLDTTNREQAIVMFLRGYKIGQQYLETEWLTADDIAALEETAKEESKSEEAQDLVSYALSKVGLAYVFGATGPNAFDCSGFVQHVFAHAGYSINRVANDQYKNGTKIYSQSELIPGDVIFFSGTYNSGTPISHVGIYIGDGKFVHAANSTRGIVVDKLSTNYYATRYYGATRILK